MGAPTQVETLETHVIRSTLNTLPLKSISSDVPWSEKYDIPLPPPSVKPAEVLDVDKGTPDSHVPRDARLIRLTGVHPFNVEAPLSALYNEGFLTTQDLFYVRNHGPVPRVVAEEIPHWEISIEGLVERPVILSLKQILNEYEQITAPITLVCAGNRRKEQNQVQKSKGFSWGAAGLSTALFTGPLMAEVLQRAKPLRTAKYVCMEGADNLPNGHYATSLKLNWVMDPNRLIMLAHKMNGEALRPDHGHPLRAVVPGQIGGRSVKWLKRLILTARPSDNWYHIYDNRVLPTMITPDMSSKDPNWWHDERYAIFDLSVNSAIAYPAHDEEISVNRAAPYDAKGYAYSGGGRRITRVELSLDKGTSWRLADVDYPEDKYRDTEKILYGGRIDLSERETCFCWCFWSINISMSDLEESDSILVRAMDESMNIQPRDMYWSVLGMMNNPWFRVTITKKNGILKFEHPTQPATIPGGWMERVKKSGGNLLNGHWGQQLGGEETKEPPKIVEVDMKKEGLSKYLSAEELKEHSTGGNPWFVVNSEVYDGTRFLEGHPGGAQSIISAAGTNATDEFMAIHSDTAKAMMSDYHIGTLDEASRKILSSNIEEEPAETREVFLQPRFWTKALLSRKEIVSWDTRLFCFKLNHEQQRLGLPVGQHIMMRIADPSTKETLIRSYTPLSDTTKKGEMELLVKLYFKTNTSPGGLMTTALDSLPMGAMVDFKGPTGKFEYLGRGNAAIGGVRRQIRSFSMICGGSGITPIFQVLREVMRDAEDKTFCVLLDCNRLLEDILCKDELDQLASGANAAKCKIVHTLTKPPEGWTGRQGRISEELIGEHIIPREDGLVLVCGPEAMEKSVAQMLRAQGWKDSNVVFF